MRTDNILLAVSAAALSAALIVVAAAFLILELGNPNLSSLLAFP